MPGVDPALPRPGARLLSAVQAITMEDKASVVQGVSCLSACKRPCAAALAAPGRVTYVFGDLQDDAETALALVSAARQHAAAVDGWLPRRQRPTCLQAGILARVPPLHWISGQPLTWPT